jgi:hypothetical protein
MKFASTLAVVAAAAVVTFVPMSITPAQASTQTQASANPVVDCKTQATSPYCHEVRDLALSSHGYKAGSNGTVYCLTAANLTGTPHKVTAQVLGHDGKVTHKVRAGATRSWCVPMPDRGCPKINLMHVTASGDYINYGTYPTCGPSWQLPTTDKPHLVVCAKNTGDRRKKLQMLHHGHLAQSVWVASGDTACVKGYFGNHWSQYRQVQWKRTSAPVREKDVLLSAVIWRN